MRRKISVLLMAWIMAISIAGCGKISEEDTPEESVTSSQQVSVEVTENSESVEVSEESAQAEVMTGKKLAEEMAVALEGKQILQATAEMEIEIAQNISLEDLSMEMELAMSDITETKISLEPYASYSRTSMTMDFMGESITTNLEVYTVVEDDTLVSYLNDVETGDWTRVDTGMNSDDMEATHTGFSWIAAKNSEELVLEDEPQMLEGKEVYVLNCTITGDEMQRALNGMSDMEEMLAQSGLAVLDFGMLTVPSVFYVDTQTFLPVKIEMDIQGMSDMMNNLMTEILEESAVEGMEDTERNIDVKKVKVVYTNISYDPVKVPTVPEEAYAQIAQAETNPDQGDGTYIIQSGRAAARITCPEEWSAVDMSYDSLTLERNDGEQVAIYTIYPYVDDGDFMYYVDTLVVPQIQDMYISHEVGPVVEGFETVLVEAIGGNMICAWGPVGEGCLFIYLVDYGCQPLEEAVKPVIELMEEYSLENVA